MRNDETGRLQPRFRRLLAVLLAVALPLTSCAAVSHSAEEPRPEDPRQADLVPQSSYNAKPRESIAEGGHLTTAMDYWPKQLNPFHVDATSQTAEIWTWYGPQLALTDWKGQWHFNSEYLDNVEAEIQGDKTVVTYTIDRNARFADGTDLDWEAFAATWRANNGSNPAFKSAVTNLYSQIASVKPGASHNQAVVTFDGIAENWQRYFPTVLHPALDTPEEFNEGYVNALPKQWGAGPFEIAAVDLDAGSLSFHRGTHWWGEPAKLEQRRFIQINGTDSLSAFRNGLIDTLDVSIRERMTSARGMEGVDIHDGISTSRRLFLLDAKSKQLQDPRVRKAIFSAVNRKEILASRYEGIRAVQELPQSMMLLQWQNGYQDNLSSALAFDVNQANAALDDAGWKLGSDGIREQAGNRLVLSIPATDRTDSARAAQTILQQQLRRIGVDVALVERTGENPMELFTDKPFNAALVVCPTGFASGVSNLEDIVSPGGLLRHTGIEDPELGNEVAGLSTLTNIQDQQSRADAVEVDIFQRYTMLPMSFYPGELAVKRGLANFGPAAFAQLPVQDVGWEL